jgi:hypothetical protein
MTDPVVMPPVLPLAWQDRWPGRLEAELGRFAELGLPADHDAARDQLVVRTRVELHDGTTTPVIVVYPDAYPDRRFEVYAPDLRLARHESFGGNLCVFPRSSRYWDPSTLAADVVATQVPELVRLVVEDGPELRALEDPQGEPQTSYYPYADNGAIVVDDRALALPPDAAGGRLVVSFDARGTDWLQDAIAAQDSGPWERRFGQGCVVSVRGPAGEELLEGDAGLPVSPQSGSVEGRWVRLAAPPWATTPEELWAAASAAAPPPAGADGYDLLGVVVREEVGVGEHDDAWLFLLRHVATRQVRARPKGRKGPTPQRREATVRGPVALRGLRWTGQDLSARVPELAALRTAAAAIVGLGSLGAPLAAELAKGQIGTLRLLDPDHMDPATAVRHPLGLEYAGVSKAAACVRWLQGQWPRTAYGGAVFGVGHAPMDGGAAGERTVLGEMLAGCSLLISATAEDDVNRYLDRVGTDLGIARLHLWGVSGYGGVIALLRKGTGCYHCLELLQSDRASAGSPLVAVPAGADDLPIQGRGCGDRTFAAHHAELLPVVAQAARVAFGQLCAGSPGGYPPASGDVFAVQLREPGGAQIPPRWEALDLPPDPRCSACSG